MKIQSTYGYIEVLADQVAHMDLSHDIEVTRISRMDQAIILG